MDTENELKQVRERETKARQELAELAKRRRELMIRLNDAGLSFQKIAEIYGVKRQRVEQIVKGRNK